ncbi:MAG: DNRLRE domain-containing protein [Verrucomicrobiota bacterium]
MEGRFLHGSTWRARWAGGVALLSGLAAGAIQGETLTVLNTQAGTTPTSLGYNLAHFMPGSNAADWFRYSGANAARIFINVSEIEPVDDLAPAGDGVDSEASFFNRRALLRANGASTSAALDPAYVNWAAFTGGLNRTTSGNNRLQLSYALAELKNRHVAILANITASPSRFPIAGQEDWTGQWELWQHYYAQAFLLGRDHAVQNYSMFNEPNGWTGMTETDWLRRHRICSDAIQSALADVNTRYGTSLVPQIFAANTANGAEKYNTIGADEATTDTWGHDAVINRHLRLDGSSSPSWMNLHIYNYQKYTTRTHPNGSLSGYVTDYNSLRGYLNADMPGEPPLPMALTEFNVRTGANYDLTTATQDSPLDFTALGANCIALTERGIQQLYLFKFGQTASASTYGVAKNGTHYVQNGSTNGNNYGGATKCAEVYRLFCKAAPGARSRLNFTTTAGATATTTGGLWSLVTHDATAGTYRVLMANKETAAIPLELDFSALPLPADNPIFVEEVSSTSSGGTVRLTRLDQGKLATADIPAQSVWLITLPSQPLVLATRLATADTQLGDGSAKTLSGGTPSVMTVRADGTAGGRRVCLIKIPVPPGNPAETPSILLQLEAATSSGSQPVQAHVYGVEDNTWTEDTLTWGTAASFLKQGIPDGNAIQHNIVAAQGTASQILGQLVVNSTIPSTHSLEVTDFVKSRHDGVASFLVVQEHRWDIAQPGLTAGDIQPAGLRITAREQNGKGPRLVALTPEPPWNVWRRSKFPSAGEDELINGAAADPDRDGIGNLLEYALGGEPLAAQTDCLPALQQVEGRLEFRFAENPLLQDLRRTIQVTGDLNGHWMDAAVSVRAAPFVSLLEGFMVSETAGDPMHTVRLTETTPDSGSRRFFRLRIELLDQ